MLAEIWIRVQPYESFERQNPPVMVAVKIDPMRLAGPWTEGYVLERQHTIGSDFVGYDSSGDPQFETKRTQLGELVFRLKNRNDRRTLDPIAETAVQFIRDWNLSFDAIVPVPPSRTRLAYQPVVGIAKAIGARLSKPAEATAVKKVRDTPELKNIFDYQRRVELLEGSFVVDAEVVNGKRVLLLDDLYRSGATAKVVAQDILSSGAAAVYLLAMTKTRTRT